MPQYQVSANQLTPNSTVHVRGKLTFSRLAKLIDGVELAKADARAQQNGSIAVGRPHTSVNLAEVEVLFADPAKPTTEELFVSERRYDSTKHPEHGKCYSLDNKSPNLPVVGVRDENNEVEQVILESDLAAGLDVTLVLRVYKPKGYANHGLSLDLVLVNEPIRYYNPGIATGELAARGIVFKTPPKQISGEEAVANGVTSASDGGGDGYPANTDAATGLPAAAPAAAPEATQPAQEPAPATQPAQAPVETPEQELARLRQQLASRDAADASSGGNSAFGAAPEHENPWTESAQAPVAQGIAYSG